MAGDKTDKIDITPAATLATTATREEIEDALFETVSLILPGLKGKTLIPGWAILFKGAVDYLDVGQAKIPTLTEMRASQLVQLAGTDPAAFDAASYIAGLNFAASHLPDVDCPKSLRVFGGQVLCGEITRPTQTGRPRAQDVPVRIWQYVLCRFTAERAPLPLSRNRDPSGPASFSACDAVAEAFTRAGHRVTQAQLASLCYDKGYADIRALAEAVNMLDFDRSG